MDLEKEQGRGATLRENDSSQEALKFADGVIQRFNALGLVRLSFSPRTRLPPVDSLYSRSRVRICPPFDRLVHSRCDPPCGVSSSLVALVPVRARLKRYHLSPEHPPLL